MTRTEKRLRIEARMTELFQLLTRKLITIFTGINVKQPASNATPFSDLIKCRRQIINCSLHLVRRSIQPAKLEFFTCSSEYFSIKYKPYVQNTEWNISPQGIRKTNHI